MYSMMIIIIVTLSVWCWIYSLLDICAWALFKEKCSPPSSNQLLKMFWCCIFPNGVKYDEMMMYLLDNPRNGCPQSRQDLKHSSSVLGNSENVMKLGMIHAVLYVAFLCTFYDHDEDLYSHFICPYVTALNILLIVECSTLCT